MTEDTHTTEELEQRVQALERELEGLVERLAEAEAKRDEYLDDLRRLAADFDNFRKRSARDQQAVVSRASEGIVRELLPVLDGLERALEAAAPSDHTDLPPTTATLDDGVRLVERQLRDVLLRAGLVEIDTGGRFDPHVHEALLSQPSEAEEGAIVQVLQKGYLLGDHVVRPARVVVSDGLAGDGDGGAGG